MLELVLEPSVRRRERGRGMIQGPTNSGARDDTACTTKSSFSTPHASCHSASLLVHLLPCSSTFSSTCIHTPHRQDENNRRHSQLRSSLRLTRLQACTQGNEPHPRAQHTYSALIAPVHLNSRSSVFRRSRGQTQHRPAPHRLR